MNRLRDVKSPPPCRLELMPILESRTSWSTPGSFSFLNLEMIFNGQINWNEDQFGKLWTYNLNYFDFLHQPGMGPDSGLLLIRDFIDQSSIVKDGLEPYPTSLRLVNWILFLSKQKIEDRDIQDHLYAQYGLLWKRIEYHLLGNHLLENGFALIIGAIYFQDQQGLNQACRLLRKELDRQILSDGGHDERSPMYQGIILLRLLHTINIVQGSSYPIQDEFYTFLKEKAAMMLGWLDQIRMEHDRFPQCNDCALGIAPDWLSLLNYAMNLQIVHLKQPLGKSGYRVFDKTKYSVLLDAGPIGPDHQPGHAHCDTLSFIMDIDGQPFLVDTGTSTYEPGPRRQLERSTLAHNTVQIGDWEQSEIWSTFRVARRSRPRILSEGANHLEAIVEGIPGWSGVHHRAWDIQKEGVEIKDILKSKRQKGARAFFHFAPGISMIILNYKVETQLANLTFSGATHLESGTYQMANGFNRLISAPLLVVHFSNALTTTIQCHFNE